MNTFERTKPEAEGISSKQLAAFLQGIEDNRLHIHSFMLLRHDHVVAEGAYEPYRIDEKHMVYSVSKSITSVAVGFAVQEGLLTLEDLVVSQFPEFVTEKTDEKMKRVRVRDLLTMRSGHTSELFDILRQDQWVKRFINSKVEKEPGSFFSYNTVGTYVLSALVQKVAGESVFEYLKTRLFTPLGFSEDISWETSYEGICGGGYGMQLRVEDMARFCTFMLHKGMWGGKQLLAATWFEQATSVQTDNEHCCQLPDWQQGYGYQFWICTQKDVYRADGAFGQLGVVMPNQDMVLVMNSGMKDDDEIQCLLNLLWEHIMVHLDRDALEGTADEQMGLTARLAALELHTYNEDEGVDIEELRISSEFLGRTYRLQDNCFGYRAITIQETEDNALLLKLELAGWENNLSIKRDCWVRSQLNLNQTISRPQLYNFLIPGCPFEHAATRGCTVDGDVLYMDIAFLQTPFQETWQLRFLKNGIMLRVRRPASFFQADMTIPGR